MKRIIASNVLVFLTGLLVCELIFGSWFHQHNYGFLTLPRDVYIVSDVEGLYDGGGRATYSRDGHGLRGRYGTPEEIDLLAMGGSTTNELYIDDCCTWSNLLGRLARQDRLELNVANAGVDGQSSVGHIWSFAAWFPNIPGLRPRFVLVYLGINERHARLELATNKGLPQYKDSARRIKQYLKNNSALFNLYKTVRGTIAAHRETLGHAVLDYASATWETMPLAEFHAKNCNKEKQEAYRTRLEVLVEKIRSLGARPILATQKRGDYHVQGDTVYGIEGTDALREAKELDCLNRSTLAFCVRSGIMCIDVANRADLRPDDFYDAIHTSPTGSAKVAQIIYEEIRPLLEP